jgi:ribosomal protein S18 acetylase RimI-like enzyme
MSGVTAAALVRPMEDADVDQAATVTAEAFGTDISDPWSRRVWEQRLRHSLSSDPEGSFVSEHRGRITGAAQAVIRDGVWVLSLMAVSPRLGIGGEGRALMGSALDYGPDSRGGLIIASNDPRALRLYASSGFSLEATFKADGAVDPSTLPQPHPQITSVAAPEFPELEAISRAARGAAHTPDLEVALFRGATVSRLEDRGFVVAMPGRGVWALAACDEEAATALLWHALGELCEESRIEIGWISGRQQWALEALVAARFSFTGYGAICARGAVGPLHPYIPSPSFA